MKKLTTFFVAPAVLVLAVSAGCTLEKADVPPLAGPSAFGLSIDVKATPDILPEDGAAQSVIRVTARDANGQPVRDLPLRIDTVVFGPNGPVFTDYGVLSARNVTTNANGEATVTFTAPRSPQPGVDTGTEVVIAVSQLGSGFGTTLQRFVNIRLVPESTVTDPGAPTPSFFFTPANPRVGDRVSFDGSKSTDDGTIVRYRWDYGDGEIEEGALNTKDYLAAGSYLVTLTVTDNQGKTASLTKVITVSGS
jgi:PKD repeat protein